MNIFEHFGAFWTKKGCKLIKNISKVMSRSTPRSQRLTTPSSSRRPMPPLSPKPLLELLGAPVVGRNSPQWIRSANQSGSFFLLPPPQQSYVGDPIVVGRNSPQWIRSANQSGSFFLLSPKIGRFSGAPKGLESSAFDFTPPRLSRNWFEIVSGFSRERLGEVGDGFRATFEV